MTTFPSASPNFIQFIPGPTAPTAPTAPNTSHPETSQQYIAARQHVLSNMVTVQNSDGSTLTQPVKRKRGRPKGSGKKQKQKQKDDDEERKRKVADDSDSSVEVTLTQTMTKSGRSVTKPSQYVPAIPSPVSHPKRRVGGSGRKALEIVVCKLCGRANSPAENPIVYCSTASCGATYHQYCHHPPIPRESIDNENADWFCSKCTRPARPGLQKNGSGKPTKLTEATTRLVPGSGLSPAEKRSYFTSLPPSTLVDLLVDISTKHAAIPLFHADHLSIIHPPPPLEPDDPGYDTDPPAHYPKPGYGLARKLPPEEFDTAWLVDDNVLGVFSHSTVNT
ncbi:hypothetical protein P152DRAFT_458176 [Eremomyces bilateralis CBS 781.70]|uniref:PHD-type domain-containing protein n=1 Tax=Eremomyces bilateralis CBS 781.70 TaxID=1392243 RepID=A0A6G1G504_9PEZI|nr:uncharacterized protein P152DRAFT_458176 [Eremomyces bilateralis CBS 781.70]KAF1813006.1 hypothetical protein P152DRAFT_458176 [Eremomyces bilateralis CBS 781.70]